MGLYMKSQPYTRGQVEWALWRYFRIEPNANDNPPTIFSTRIKRLLELDRVGIEGAPGFAFSSAATTGRGSNANFTAFDVFCLAVAMDLLDTGFKQSEIVFFLAFTRSSLEREFRYMMKHPFPLRQNAASEDFPELPTYMANGFQYADGRVYMGTRKVELKEFVSDTTSEDQKRPQIQTPLFFRGIEALVSELNANPIFYNKLTLIELSQPARRINELLQDAPEIKRGRT